MEKKTKERAEKLAGLLGRLQNGDDTVLGDLLKETYSLFRFYARKRVLDEHEFQDIITDSLLDLLQKPDAFTDASHMLKTLHLKVRDKSTNAFHRNRKFRVIAEVGLEELEDQDDQTADFELIDPYDKLGEINRAIDDLAPSYRKVMILYYREGKKVNEIVEELGIKQGTVSRLKTSGNEQLRKKFKELPKVIDINLLHKSLMLLLRLGGMCSF